MHSIRLSRPVVAVGALLASSLPAPLAAQTDSVATASRPRHRWWLSGQLNVISQWHPTFAAPYSGPNSLLPAAERATSGVATLYSGLSRGHTEILFDLESAFGGGISQAFGLAGFTNLDVVRNPTLGAAPYIARALVRHTIALGPDSESATPGPLAVLRTLPVRRLSLVAGKLGMADFFDVNSAGGDSHLQFMNWTVDNNGAYDYAADTRGYTGAVMIELHETRWTARFAEALMPKVANGIAYDWGLGQAHADNLELEWRPLFHGHDGAIRVLLYANHANMGTYAEAIAAFRAGRDSLPDITAHRQPGTTKTGVGLNAEQEIVHGIQVFGRAGLGDGRKESFAYTEVDQSAELGVAWTTPPWHHKDRLGVAVVSNGISGDHREYLKLGGRGFLLGDGTLNYGREQIAEMYYTLHLVEGASFAFDFQHIGHPGYNRDRGPVNVLAVRAHLDFPPAP